MSVIVSERSPEDIRSTIYSLYASIGQVVSIFTIFIINWMGNYGVRTALVAYLVIYLPLLTVVGRGFVKTSK